MCALRNFCLFFVLGLVIINTSLVRAEFIVSQKDKRKGIQYDMQGRIIFDPAAAKKNINYPQSPTAVLVPAAVNTTQQSKSSVQATVTPLTLALNRIWSYVTINGAIGIGGLFSGDFNGDGKTEVLVGNPYYWLILEKNPQDGTYRTAWVSPFLGKYADDYLNIGIQKIQIFKLNNSANLKFYVATADGKVHVFDAKTRLEESIIETGLNWLTDIVFADGDNDGAVELMASGLNSTVFINMTTGAVEHTIPYGSEQLAVGQVDADSLQEIVLSDGRVFEYNGTTVTEQWNFASGYGSFSVRIGDVDGNGANEIIAEKFGQIFAFDAATKIQKWTLLAVSGDTDLQLKDCNGDGRLDILYGDGQWGSIHCKDGLTLNELFSIPNPDHGVFSLNLLNTDNDAQLEVVWAAGISSSGADHLYIYEVPSLQKEWQSDHLDGPFNALVVDDLDNNAVKEIVAITSGSDSGYGDGRILIFDAKTFGLKWQSPSNFLPVPEWTGLRDFKVANLDQDPQKEIVLAATQFYTPVIYVIDSVTHAIERTFVYDNPYPFTTINISDIDNDGDLEIISSYLRNVVIINPVSGAVEKTIPDTVAQYAVNNLKVDNIDGNGTPEILVEVVISSSPYDNYEDNLRIINPVTSVSRSVLFKDYRCFTTLDSDNNGTKEIIIGTKKGEIVILNQQSLAEMARYAVSDREIRTLNSYDVDGDNFKDVIYAGATTIGIFSIKKKASLWQDKSTGVYSSLQDLVPGDANQNGLFDLTVGTSFGLHQFEAPNNAKIVSMKVSTHDPVNGVGKAIFRVKETIRFKLLLKTESAQSVKATASGSAYRVEFGNWSFNLPVQEKVVNNNEIELTWDVKAPDPETNFTSLGEVKIIADLGSGVSKTATQKFWIKR